MMKAELDAAIEDLNQVLIKFKRIALMLEEPEDDWDDDDDYDDEDDWDDDDEEEE